MESQSAEYPNTGKVITTVDLPTPRGHHSLNKLANKI